MTPIAARDLIENARNMARLSRDEMMPALRDELTALKMSGQFSDEQLREMNQKQQTARMDLVMDAYLTGAAELLKLIHGDRRPEPWTKFDWETRLNELLQVYGLKL